MNRVTAAVKWLLTTSWPLYATSVLGSNIAIAVSVMLFIKFLLPMPSVQQSWVAGNTQLAIATLGYAIFALISGLAATVMLFKPVLVWQRHPEEHDPNMVRNLVMRLPTYQAAICAVIWLVGIVVITAFAAPVDQQLAVVVAIATSMAGMMAVVLTYLEAARLVRPVAAEALARRFEDATLEPPVAHRLFLTWFVSTGVPVIGIGLLLLGHQAGFFGYEPGALFPAIFSLCALALVGGGFSTLLAIAGVVDPIRELQQAINRVRRGDASTQVDIYDGSELGVLQAGFNEMMRGLAERQRVRDLFGRYVGAEVAQRALEERPTLGGEARKVAVLFIDVTGSTTYAVDHTPQEVVAALNAFFERVVTVVNKHRGFINKFQGDAALAVFGAPLPLPDATGQALAAARELKQALKGLPLDCGIGVAMGTVVAGHIGGADRFEYTVIGDAVNQAARLTDLAKNTPGGVLTSAATLRDANEAEQARWTVMKSVELRGRRTMTQLARPIRPTLADRNTIER